MAYYGLAGFAGDFNRVRDDALDSGFRAKQRMREDWLSDYQMPGQMLGADANELSNSLKYDTLNQGYGDMLKYGLNNAALGATTSGVNLHQAQADDTLAGLRARAVKSGLTTDTDIANYVANNIDPAEAAANPYLANAGYAAQQGAYRKLLAMGTALSGPAGDALAGQGAAGLGYGLTPGRDDAGNLIFTDAQGRASGAFGQSGQIPAALALSGDPASAAQYYGNLERMRADAAKVTAQLQQRDTYADLRYQTDLERQQMRDEVTREGYANRLQTAQMRGQKGRPSAIGMSAIGGGGGTVGAAMPGAPMARYGFAQPYGTSVGTTTGTSANPFMTVPSPAGSPGAAAGPVSGPALPAPVMPPGLPGVPAYQPARLTPDASARLAALNGATSAAPASTPATVPGAGIPAPASATTQADPQAEFNDASASYDRAVAALRKLESDAGGMTVYGPRNGKPGFGVAHQALSNQVYEAQTRRDAARKAVDIARYQREQQRQLDAQRKQHEDELAAGRALAAQYMPRGGASQ